MPDQLLSETVFAIVDVETTGLHPHAGDRVCEVALLRCVGETQVERFDCLIDPGRTLSPGAAAVNGLTNAQLRGQPRFAAVAPQVLALLDGAVLVAHNVPFDLRFLDTELARLGLPVLVNPCVDTLELARATYRLPSYSLGNLAYRLGIAVGGAHRALADVLTTRRLLSRLIYDRGAMWLSDLAPSAAALPANVPVPMPLDRAIREHRRLYLQYRSSEGITERWVEPMAVQSRAQGLYLVAYCHLRQERRTFRLDRIVTMRLEGEERLEIGD